MPRQLAPFRWALARHWENPRKLRQTWVSVPRCRGNLQRPGAENHRFMVKKPAREQTGY